MKVGASLVALAALAIPTQANAAYPGANGRIFFDTGGTDRDIISIAPDGGDRRSVTKGIEVAVSPDGRQIAFVRGGDLFVASRTGDDPLAITDTEVVERTPSFSPSGNKLVFATDFDSSGPGRGEPGHVFTIRTNGSDRTRLTQSDFNDSEPSYSPSGNKIVFVRVGSDATSQLYKMDPDGSNRDQLTSGPQGYPAESPTWSPDGDRIAFERFVNGDISIYSIEPDGSDLIQHTFGDGARNREPSYSPSGRKIVYRGQTPDEQKALYVIDAAGTSTPERLTAPRPSGVDARPYWGPIPSQ
jgi:Tol biopolymer transport system component